MHFRRILKHEPIQRGRLFDCLVQTEMLKNIMKQAEVSGMQFFYACR